MNDLKMESGQEVHLFHYIELVSVSTLRFIRLSNTFDENLDVKLFPTVGKSKDLGWPTVIKLALLLSFENIFREISCSAKLNKKKFLCDFFPVGN